MAITARVPKLLDRVHDYLFLDFSYSPLHIEQRSVLLQQLFLQFVCLRFGGSEVCFVVLIRTTLRRPELFVF